MLDRRIRILPSRSSFRSALNVTLVRRRAPKIFTFQN